ncbi:MAG TPA: histidine kinase dimerization/phospho-acceptor domain-containing protein, partial [Thermoanaerobaculia bacterium]|nr:histidine kinase dimerization/phospho-acceptor domain-containing protein [Thermoanaerobaculia bacterium]
MDAPAHDSEARQHGAPVESLEEALRPGVLRIGNDGSARSGDPRALALLGGTEGSSLESLWGDIRPRLEEAGLGWQEGGPGHAALDLTSPTSPAGARLHFDLYPASGGDGVLLVSDAQVAEALEADLRLSSQMRALSQISPAVAHDLRAPINAMVFNIEVLKETLAAAGGLEPAMRDRQLRYVNVLKEELNRLHKSLEVFIAHTSPRGDRVEVLDLRELLEELGALLVGPARKQQVQVKTELGGERAALEVNRYLLRQALLHVALAVLGPVPRQGTLVIRLECQEEAVRVRIEGVGGEPAAAGSPASSGQAAQEPGFGLLFSPGGTIGPLHVARAILAAQAGGELRPAGSGAAP